MNHKRIFSDALVSGLRKFTFILHAIILIPVITRLLGEDVYGIWVIILSIVSISTVLGGMHLHGSLIRYSERKTNVFSEVLLLSIISALSSVILVFIIFVIYNSFISSGAEITEYTHQILLLIFTGILLKICKNNPRSKGNVKLFEIITVLHKILETLTVVSLLLYFQNLSIALWGLVGINSFAIVTLLISFKNDMNFYININNFRDYFTYGGPMIPKDLSEKVIHDADKYLVFVFLGATQTGIYAVSYTVASIIQKISAVFNSTLYPNVISAWENDNIKELKYFYKKYIKWYVVLAVPSVFGIFLVADSLLRLISTESIASEGVVLLPMLAIGIAIHGLGHSLIYPLAAQEKTMLISKVTLSAGVINIFLNVLLIPLLGLFGAAIATVVAYAFRTTILYRYTQSYFSIPIPVHSCLKSTISSLIMFSILYFLSIRNVLLEIIITVFSGVIIFSIVFIMIGGLNENEKRYIVGIIKNA